MLFTLLSFCLRAMFVCLFISFTLLLFIFCFVFVWGHCLFVLSTLSTLLFLFLFKRENRRDERLLWCFHGIFWVEIRKDITRKQISKPDQIIIKYPKKLSIKLCPFSCSSWIFFIWRTTDLCQLSFILNCIMESDNANIFFTCNKNNITLNPRQEQEKQEQLTDPWLKKNPRSVACWCKSLQVFNLYFIWPPTCVDFHDSDWAQICMQVDTSFSPPNKSWYCLIFTYSEMYCNQINSWFRLFLHSKFKTIKKLNSSCVVFNHCTIKINVECF